MVPLRTLITALIRLIALFYGIRSLDSATEPLFWMIVQQGVLPETPIGANPIGVTLLVVTIYLLIAVIIFLLAPKLAELFIGPTSDSDDSQVPWHETLIFVTGVILSAWALVRISDSAFRILLSADQTNGIYQLDTPMFVYLSLTFLLLAAGLLLIAKFHRISRWMDERRKGKHVS